MNRVYLGLGTNLGNKEINILSAIDFIEKEIGLVKEKSSLFLTKAFGFESENDFYNCVILIETALEPFELLNALELIEAKLGRTNKSTNKTYFDRLIDIDILYFNELIVSESNLKIPHPEIKNRTFVLEPMLEIAKDFIDPKEEKSIAQLLDDLNFKKLFQQK